MAMNDLQKLVLRWTLVNAEEHDGKAVPDAVIGKIIAARPDLRSEIEELVSIVEETVRGVNRLSLEEQRSRLEGLGAPEKLEAEEREGLPELPDAEKYDVIITRFAPNPNGPLHIGHVRAAVLSHEYARRHDGRFILRFEDTNPANARSEMYDLIREDLEWLGLRWDEEHMQSRRLEIYYDYAERLLRDDKAYVCTCDPKKFKELRDRGVPCPCRERNPEEYFKRWRGMLGGEFSEGEAVVRIKTDLDLPNPTLRDWPALRISEVPHAQVGERYRVWPLYNFSVAVDDHEMEITHVIRGKEHEVNEQRQRQLFKRFDWEYPTVIQHGRLSMPGVVLSKTRVMEGIEGGDFKGPDDVRLGTIAALRRRGFVAESLRQVVLDIGLTRVSSTLSWDTLCTENRKVIDDRANRYFFVPDPEELLIHDVPDREEARLRLHPDHLDRGERVLPLDLEDGDLRVWIPSEDMSELERGDVVRLKDLLNFKLISKEPFEAEFEGFELADVSKIQWTSADPVDVEVLKPDGPSETGYGEPEVAQLSIGEIIQFERYGFVRVEEVGQKVLVVFAHR